MVLNSEGRAAAGAKVSLRITDRDHEQVHSVELVASKFGIVHDDWPVGASAELGEYDIVLKREGSHETEIARHQVRLSRYELPVFHVTAKPDRTAYLPGKEPRVTVSGEYLFGKPVPKGQVKIVRNNDSRWNRKTRKSESTDETVAEGEAGADGIFIGQLNVKANQEKLRDGGRSRFEDIHFSAYYKDMSSGRTEQRRFDVRITRDAIHVYVVHAQARKDLPSEVYISTSYADGRPASAAVNIVYQDQTTSLRTNRYGIGKAMLLCRGDWCSQSHSDEGQEAKITATDSAGLTGVEEVGELWRGGGNTLQLETKHTIYRQSEPVTVRVTTSRSSVADQFVMVHAIAGDRDVASRVARITNHKGEITFPYQAEFQRTVVFAAWTGVDAESDHRVTVPGSTAVVFPDGADLRVSATTDRNTYRPGEKTSLRMQVVSANGTPVDAALGLAVVDQAVLERARTDNEFGHRRWFGCTHCGGAGDREIGGISLDDLYALQPAAAISPELDLVAEALVAGTGAMITSDSSESIGSKPEFPKVTAQMRDFQSALDKHYADSLEFPRDVSALWSALGRRWSDLEDPWGMSYLTEFSVNGRNFVITLRSAGPDKRRGTADDFIIATFRRPYFTPLQHLIKEVLNKQDAYPATDTAFVNLLSANGLLLNSLPDPWGTPY